MVKGILFDAADVFYRRAKSTNQFAAELLAAEGLQPAGDQAVTDGLRDLHRQATRGEMSAPRYWDESLRIQGVADPARRAVLVPRILEHAGRVEAIPGGREAMAGLKERGFLLGIVTDTVYALEQKMSWLARVGVAEFIDVVACSSSLGLQKPDPAIYLNAVKQAGLSPGQCAFVGHDTRELAGARAAGLTTVAVFYEPDAVADHYAPSLPALLDVPIFAAPDAHEAIRAA